MPRPCVPVPSSRRYPGAFARRGRRGQRGRRGRRRTGGADGGSLAGEGATPGTGRRGVTLFRGAQMGNSRVRDQDEPSKHLHGSTKVKLM